MWGLRLRLSHNSSGSGGSQPWMQLLRSGTLLTRHGAKNNYQKLPTCSGANLSNTILRGVIPTCHTDFLDVDTVVGVNICCCYSAVISFRLSRSKEKTRFSASLLLAPPEKPSASHLGGWTAVTRWHLIPFSLWNINSIPSYSLTESSPLAAFLWVSKLCLRPFSRPFTSVSQHPNQGGIRPFAL